MTHNIAYNEVGHLRRDHEATTYFKRNFDLFMQFAVATYDLYYNLYSHTGKEYYLKDVHRVDVLQTHIQTDDPLWIQVLEGKTANGKPLLPLCSNIVARLIVGHEKKFRQIPIKDLTLEKQEELRHLLKEIIAEFDL